MTLYKFLVDQMGVQAKKSAANLRNDKEFHKCLGGAEMCDKLISLLSDETLKMEVVTRNESLNKGR